MKHETEFSFDFDLVSFTIEGINVNANEGDGMTIKWEDFISDPKSLKLIEEIEDDEVLVVGAINNVIEKDLYRTVIILYTGKRYREEKQDEFNTLTES